MEPRLEKRSIPEKAQGQSWEVLGGMSSSGAPDRSRNRLPEFKYPASIASAEKGERYMQTDVVHYRPWPYPGTLILAIR